MKAIKSAWKHSLKHQSIYNKAEAFVWNTFPVHHYDHDCQRTEDQHRSWQRAHNERPVQI